MEAKLNSNGMILESSIHRLESQRTRSKFQVKRIVFVAAALREREQSRVCIQIIDRLHFCVGQAEVKYVDVALNAFFMG